MSITVPPFRIFFVLCRLQEMSSIYTYQGEETCAADGMCQVKCPVKINTGDLIKSIRKEQLGQDSRASKTAMVHSPYPTLLLVLCCCSSRTHCWKLESDESEGVKLGLVCFDNKGPSSRLLQSEVSSKVMS